MNTSAGLACLRFTAEAEESGFLFLSVVRRQSGIGLLCVDALKKQVVSKPVLSEKAGFSPTGTGGQNKNKQKT